MILVDTSVWVDHLRTGDATLKALLIRSQILTHPFVIGELALCPLAQRKLVLSMIDNLPKAPVAADSEALLFIDRHGLAGTGIGYIDAHLLAAARLSPGTGLWTRDKRLSAVAKSLSLDAQPAV